MLKEIPLRNKVLSNLYLPAFYKTLLKDTWLIPGFVLSYSFVTEIQQLSLDLIDSTPTNILLAESSF